MSPRFRLYIALSLDGYVATLDGGIKWLEPYQHAAYGYDEFIEDIEVIVMGRVTYEQVRTFGDWPYKGKRVIVLSGSLKQTDLPDGVEHHNRDAKSLIADLRQADLKGGVWVLGGPRTIGSFYDLQAIDKMTLFVMPCLLGAGVGMWSDPARAGELELIDVTAHENGSVQLTYHCKP